MEKVKRHNATQTEFKQEEFLQLLKNKYNLDNKTILIIESMLQSFKNNNDYTLYMYNYEYKKESNKMIYYYIYKYVYEVLDILNNADIETDIKNLIDNNIIIFD